MSQSRNLPDLQEPRTHLLVLRLLKLAVKAVHPQQPLHLIHMPERLNRPPIHMLERHNPPHLIHMPEHLQLLQQVLHYLTPRSQVCLCPINLILQCLEDITHIKGIPSSNLITLHLILDKLLILLMVIRRKVLPNHLPLIIHLDNSPQIQVNPHNGDNFLCKILL